MQLRILATAVCALACSACANDRAPQVLGYQAVAAPAPIETGATAGMATPALKKTMASKVLAAIALERVTGRKPDPSRLAEVD